MATLNKMFTMAALAGLALFGCGKLGGLDTPVTPLKQIHFQVGDSGSVLVADATGRIPQLRVAIVWGAQSLPEPFCVFRPEGAQTVAAAGCPDIFRFVPDRASADVAVEPGVPATIDILNLPSAGVMVGDVTSRVAYASLIVYDDRNGNGMLDFHHPKGRDHEEGYDPGTPPTRDVPYGASFISMTKPDQRVAYLEGIFNNGVAFYPRYGCESSPPLPGFSILSAGGYSQPDPVVAELQGQLTEVPATCSVATLDEVVLTIPLQPVPDPLQPPDYLKELACTVTDTSGATSYQRAPDTAPDLSISACVGFPQIPGDPAGVASGNQLVVAGATRDPCLHVNHFTLRGCRNDPSCAAPTWDDTATPPMWWPCPTAP